MFLGGRNAITFFLFQGLDFFKKLPPVYRYVDNHTPFLCPYQAFYNGGQTAAIIMFLFSQCADRHRNASDATADGLLFINYGLDNLACVRNMGSPAQFT